MNADLGCCISLTAIKEIGRPDPEENSLSRATQSGASGVKLAGGCLARARAACGEQSG